MKKSKSIALLLISLIFYFLIPFSQNVLAVEFIGGEELFVDEEKGDDTYIGGGMVNVEKDVKGDLIIGGGKIKITGNVEEDLMIVGGEIVVNGDVGGDIRVMGGSIYINGNVGDDVISAGGNIDISEDSVIGGTLTVGAGYLEMRGTVTEDITGGLGKAYIGGTVNGKVDLIVEEGLILSKSAKIEGDLTYKAIKQSEISQEQVGGNIEYNKLEEEYSDFEDQFKDNLKNIFSVLYLASKAIFFFGLLILGLFLILMIPASFDVVSTFLNKSVFKSFGIGFVAIIVGVAIAVILALTVAGLTTSGIIMGFLIIYYSIGKIYAARWLGNLIIRSKKITKWKLFLELLLGAFILTVISFVPVVGGILNILIFVAAFGAVLRYNKLIRDNLQLGEV